MTTPQVAISNLKRSLQFTLIASESDSKLYKKGVAHIEEIRDLAIAIAKVSVGILSEYGVPEPEPLFEREEVETKEKYIKNQKNTNKSLEEQVKDASKYAKSHKEEIKKSISESCQATSLDLASIPKVFKTVAHKTSDVATEEFKFPQTKAIATVVSQYFGLRFSAKNDPNHIHKFRRQNFRDYMLAWVIAYSDYNLNGKSSTFRGETDKFFDRVKSGKERYTLPKFVANYFFKIVNEGILDLNVETRAAAMSIWNDLWVHGYNMFESIDSIPTEYLPDSIMNWAYHTENN